MTVLATIVLLGVLIFVHELGHYWAAKAVGIEVQRFSIGFGPRIVGFQRGETEYVISAIPLGGYVKMGGMDDDVMDRIEGGAGSEPARQPSGRDFDGKPIWARALVISAGVIMNMLFAFVVYTFLAGFYGERNFDTTRIGTIEASTLPPGTEALADVEPGSRFARVGELDIEHWGDLESAVLDGTPGPVSVEVVEPSRRLEIRIPVTREERIRLLRSITYWVEAGVGVTEPGSPAARAGLQAGDRVIAVEGDPTRNWFDFVEAIQARPGERVEVTLEREGDRIVRALELESTEVEGADGSVQVIGRAGILPPTVPMTYEPVPLREAVVTGYRETVAVTGLIVGILRDLVTGGISPRNVGSIVTIGEMSGQMAAQGLDAFLGFMALFSVNLAVLNLLPIPVLDGGHLVFLAVEAVRGGRPLSVEQRLKWSNVGFFVLVGIMLWALSNDFLRLLGL